MASNKSKLQRILEPEMRGFFAAFFIYVLCSFAAAVMAERWVSIVIASAGLAVFIVSYTAFRRTSLRRRRDILRYVDNAAIGADFVKNSVADSPFPMAVVRLTSGEVVWSNNSFGAIAGGRQTTGMRMSGILPEFSMEWLIDGRAVAPESVRVGERWFNVHGTAETVGKGNSKMGALYFIDCTDYRHMRDTLESVQPVVGMLVIDAYDEITKNLNDTQKSGVLADIDTALGGWVTERNCILRRYDRDKYFLFCPRAVLDKFVEERFSVLDSVRGIVSRDIPVTLSIGFGVEGDFIDMYSEASLAIDMALSRGGDQAVIKDKINFSFYGGRTQEMEKRTKVKSRVMANALRRLILDSSDVFIMGHRNSDLDSVGAAGGIVCACRALERAAYIVVDRDNTAATAIIERLTESEKYDNVFINPSDAMVKLGPSSLLIVVDTNRPDTVESPELLASCYRVAVIDHHRRAASYIDNAALSLHEPYASSTCELVCEMLEYMDINTPLLRQEADALLSGIVLDTKNFTFRTGSRTFEAAATLRLAGADTIEIRRLFQTDFDSYRQRHIITDKALMYNKTMAVSIVDQQVDRVVAAQAADELLTITDVQASFVLFPDRDANGDVVVVSARSLGKVNVQVILEKLGGGGHLNMAGAQISNRTPDEVLAQLYVVLDEYINETKN